MQKLFEFLLLCLINGITASLSQDKTLVRHKRWLWGGCGLIPNCEKCSNYHLCVKCESGFMFMEYRSSLLRKIVQCTKTCPVGYKIKYKPWPACVYTKKACKVPHCKTCNPRRPQSCLQCTRGFFLYRPSIKDNAKCVRKCPPWCSATVLGDGSRECTLSTTECRYRVPNCERCLDKTWCRKCKHGFLTHFNSVNLTMDCVKKCPRKHRQIKSQYFGEHCEKREKRIKCQAIDNCEHCPNTSSCNKCSKNYLKIKSTVLDDTRCVRTCPKGFNSNGKRCVRIKADGCQDDFCLVCIPGLYRVRRGLCRSRCPKGYYTVGNERKFCVKCSVGCYKCVSSRKCSKCLPGYHRLKSKKGRHCVRYCPKGYTARKHRQRSICHRS